MAERSVLLGTGEASGRVPPGLPLGCLRGVLARGVSAPRRTSFGEAAGELWRSPNRNWLSLENAGCGAAAALPLPVAVLTDVLLISRRALAALSKL
mmetsp:Transcript_23320/g.38360  ORF Transcript_23320/g.38360 Transcript_23320/m.38360 type:complete len:96 (+) Transcript_23320:909-1196(+)